MLGMKDKRTAVAAKDALKARMDRLRVGRRRPAATKRVQFEVRVPGLVLTVILVHL